jgi:hypothetical protein
MKLSLNTLIRTLSLLTITYSALANQAKDSTSLYIFLLDECRISIFYTQQLNELHNKYGEDILFVGVFPNFSSKPDKIARWVADYKITFPTKTDYFKTISTKMGATVTPEVVLYNHTTDKILYQGRIDDQYTRVGQRKGKATRNDLREVLEKYTIGVAFETYSTEPIGCFINYDDLNKK